MDIDIFRRFLAVVECGSMNKAAQTLHVSQPALSKSIQQLEDVYGVPLLHRGAQGIAPTEYGLFLVERFKLMRAELTHVDEEMRARRTASSRRLNLGAPPGMGYVSRLLVRATVALSEGRNPIALDVHIGGRGYLLPMLKSGDIDLLLAEIVAEEQEDFEQELLFVDRHVLAVRDGHPLAGMDRVRLEDLLRFPWAIGRDSEAVARSLIAAGKAGGLMTQENSLVRSESSLYISSVVANSDYVGIVTTDTLELGILSDQFRRFWVEGDLVPPQVERRIGVLYRSEAALTHAGRAMLRELRKARPAPEIRPGRAAAR
jgi:DNA-binding transcriptional LysR family regulator